eukprot:jgi/Botrbrau1/1261/Bobra.0163s0054.1
MVPLGQLGDRGQHLAVSASAQPLIQCTQRVSHYPRSHFPGNKWKRGHARACNPRLVSVCEAASSVSAAPAKVTQTPLLPNAAEAGQGITLHADGSATFRVWAPHASAVSLQLKGGQLLPLHRLEHDWVVSVPPGMLEGGSAYSVLITAPDGRQLERRDLYARSADYDSAWCYVDDPTAFKWETDWTPPPFDSYIIYEMHVGSFTPEGTFAAAMDKLEHLAETGFTCVQLMPIAEYSDRWGYNPRQLMAVHGPYGSPDDLRRFIDKAHSLGMAVIVDVVLHHGAPDLNSLWEYDGWGPDWNGGIYHEGAPDGPWGRALAFWKTEVREMLYDTCAMWLRDFKVDGLRFDSANDLPPDVIQGITWHLHEQFPGRILTAEVTPENPMSVHELGFDSVWVHSGYFDIIQQHRALGRGHHGGGDWAEGWNLPRLRTAMGLHYGFTSPTQCIKYLLGSHDQVGCQHGGKWYEDYQMIGGQHRYAADQYGGGRGDPNARACVRLWYAANVAAAGLVLVFMGTEHIQTGWWDISEERRINWDLAADEIGQQTLALFRDANKVRQGSGALRKGYTSILHEDRPNGVMAFDRTDDSGERILAVVNAGRSLWAGGEYGVYVGSGVFQEILCSQAPIYGGPPDVVSNSGRTLTAHDGKLYINLPAQCTLWFRQTA